jgi:CRISPR/Cas system-associated endonuclease Cas1
LHKIQFGRPSLVCDFIELYRHLIDNFLIEYCQDLGPKDFCVKTGEKNKKRGKRVYLNDSLTQDLVDKLFAYFQTKVYIPSVKRGRKQELETLINEEAFRISRYLRLKGESWVPGIPLP